MLTVPPTTTTTTSMDVERGPMMPIDQHENRPLHRTSIHNGPVTNHKILTSRQPAFPSEYGFREGNAVMIGILGFVMATLPISLLELFQPRVHIQPSWLYIVAFGGLLQFYSSAREYRLGNSLSASVFFLYACHYFASGILLGDLAFLRYVGEPFNPNGSTLGCYFITFNLFNMLLLLCVIQSVRGSWLLAGFLFDFQVRLVLLCVYCWWPTKGIDRAAGVFGVFAALIFMFIFYVDSVFEDGVVLGTGKFHNGVRTRSDVRGEVYEIYDKKAI
jgi:succinate-acetate transporter protein